MEATCQYRETTILERGGVGSQATHEYVCGAPIPRLDEGPCQRCGASPDGPEHDVGDYVRDVLLPVPRHAYLGPLASKCTNGHSVAVEVEYDLRS